MRIFAIGDIHGHLVPLDAILSRLELNVGDTVVTLGDYIDRGPDSAGVIRRLIQLKERCNLIALRGNHDSLMLESRDDPDSLTKWIRAGTDASLRSYGGAAGKLCDIPPDHWEFVASTLLYYETKTHIFVHAGLVPDKPLNQQPESVLLCQMFDRLLPHVSGKMIVCGHTHQLEGVPKFKKYAICLDTNIIGPDGYLSCLNVASGNVFRANAYGKIDALQIY